MVIYLLAFILSLISSALACFFLKRVTPRPGQGISTLGGVGIIFALYLGFALTVIFFKINLPVSAKGILLASSVMFVFGLIDDWRELSVLFKFAVQIIATSVLVFSGVKTHIVYLGPILNGLVTFIWVIGITNALNHLDVMDGAAAGVGLLAALSFLALSILGADIQVALLLSALSGALAGFLVFNFPPAKIYMGNAGSHFLGFILAAVAITISYAPLERKTALLAPVFILGFAVYDTLLVMVIRSLKKKSVFGKSQDHYSLLLLRKGYTKKWALLVMYGFAALYCLCGLASSRLPDLLNIILILILVFISLVVAIRAARYSLKTGVPSSVIRRPSSVGP